MQIQFFPINNQTIDMTSYVTNSVDQLVNTYSGLFLTTVQPYLTPALLVGIVIAGLFWMFDYPVRAMQYLFRTLIAYVGVVWMLRYYNTPMPLVGIPFSQIFRLEGKFLSGVIDIGILNVFLTYISAAFQTNGLPGLNNIFQAVLYFLVMFSLLLPEIALFVETSFAIIALGIGALLGPLFIAAYLLPFAWAKQLFWSWFHAMLKFALYRVFASALTFIWASAEMAFISGVLNGSTSLPSTAATLLALLVFNISCLLLCFRLPRLVSDFTSGSAYSGGGWASGVAGVAYTVGRAF